MFPFYSLHVLALYAWNRVAGILEFDEIVYEEIQRRAALIPPAQRQAAIDAMVKNRVALGKEVIRRKKIEEDKKIEDDRAKARAFGRNRWIGLVFWLIVVAYIFSLGYRR